MGKGRAPCCDKNKVKKGPWSPAEDSRLTAFIHKHGHNNWRALPKLAGLKRCGKSCRLRWINYLRPDVKRGNFTPQEHLTIINLHNSIGNKWSKIASYLPGRTDNEIKNVWNTHLKKRVFTSNTLQTEPKHHSASPSCTSSSTTSAGGHNVENALGEEPEFLKVKGKTTSDDSPTSSHHASGFSDGPNKAFEFTVMNPAEDDGHFEIPPESDVDFWELFGSLQDEDKTVIWQNPGSVSVSVNEQCGINNPAEKLEWFRLLEDELGLTSDVDPIKDKNIVTTNPQYEEEMNLEQPGEMGPGIFDYFPIWPSSPQILGIN